MKKLLKYISNNLAFQLGLDEKPTIFNKIYSLFICIIVVIGTICAFIMIFTEVHNITCLDNGKCSYYATINLKPNIINFNVTNQSNISCEVKKVKDKKDYYRLVIKDFNNDSYFEIPKVPRVISIKNCELFSSVIQPIIKKENKTLNYTYYPGRQVPWYGYLLYLFMLSLACWSIYFTYNLFTKKYIDVNPQEKHIDKKA